MSTPIIGDRQLDARLARVESRLVGLRTESERERGALADRVTAALAVESLHRERDMDEIYRVLRDIVAGLDAARKDIVRCNEVLAALLREREREP